MKRLGSGPNQSANATFVMSAERDKTLGAAGETAAGIRIHDSVEFGLLAMDAYRMAAKVAA